MHMLRAESVCLRAVAWVGVCVITRLLLHVCVFIPFTVSKASGRQQQLVCLCVVAQQTCLTLHDITHFLSLVYMHTHAQTLTLFTVSLTAFRHGVTPHFARRFAHTIALLVCLCVCLEELQVWWIAGVSGVTWISAQHTPSRSVASGQQCFSFWSQSNSLKLFTVCVLETCLEVRKQM